MSKISVVDLEVFYRIGITAEERLQPQRLLLTVEMEHDFAAAAAADELARTINYFDVSQELLRFGEGREWNLIETLAVEQANFIFERYHPQSVSVEVKKFPIPQARYVAVKWTRSASGSFNRN